MSAHCVDCASRFNYVLPRYFAAALEAECEGLDYFRQKLNQDELYLTHPHPRKLWLAIQHLWEQKANAVGCYTYG